MTKWLDFCRKRASEIPYIQSRERVYSCILNHKGRLIAHGANEYSRSHPTQKAYSVKAGMSEGRIFLHSECRCIIQAAKHNPKGCKLITTRVNRQGKILDSYPCISCMMQIKDSGFITSIEFGIGE